MAQEGSPAGSQDQPLAGGYTGARLSAPIYGLPEGMTVQQGNALLAQQRAAEGTEPGTEPTEPIDTAGLITVADVPRTVETTAADTPGVFQGTQQYDMKQPRISDGTYSSAAQFHVDRGVPTPGELDKVNGISEQREQRKGRFVSWFRQHGHRS